MHLTIAAIADTHYAAAAPAEGGRRCAWAPALLRQAVELINTRLQPDVTLLLGDLLNNGDPLRNPQARAELAELRAILSACTSPVLAIPGNHDTDVALFRSLFPVPDHLDVAGCRLVPFIDRDEPAWNASRSAADLERMAAARRGAPGPLLSVQHVPLFPEGLELSPYRYLNAADVVAALRANGYVAAISGHFHSGFGPHTQDGIAYVGVPALCEAPFPLLEIALTDADGAMQMRTAWHLLRPPVG